MHTYEILGHQYAPTDRPIGEGDVVINCTTGKWGVVLSVDKGLDEGVARIKRNELIREIPLDKLLHVERIEDDEVEDDNEREGMEDEGDVVVDDAGVDEEPVEVDGDTVTLTLPSGKVRTYVKINGMLVRPWRAASVRERLERGRNRVLGIFSHND